MRYFILLFLALGLGVSACSKKSSSAPPPPVTDDDNNGGYDDDYNDPDNGDYYVGYVALDPSRISIYSNFIRAGLYNGYSPTNNWSYTYSCSTNFLDWIFNGGRPFNCSGSGYSDYIYHLATKPAMVELSFNNGNIVEGRWLLNATTNSAGQVFFEQAISFNGQLSLLSDGRYQITAGPLVFSNRASSTINYSNFDVHFVEPNVYYTYFGNVTIR